MHRFIVKPSDIKNNSVLLDDKESHHAIKVLRLQVGDAVQIMDGKGSSHTGFVSSLSEGRVLVSLDPNQKIKKTSGVRVTLACGMIKADRMEWMIEKACELGVSEIIPLATERTVVRLDPEERLAKQKRWQKIAEASCKQCGMSEIPMIQTPMKWKDFLIRARSSELRLIPNLAIEASPLKNLLSGTAVPASVVFAVGPEGDFTPDEVQVALREGFKSTHLGDLVMRSETAALFVLGALRLLYGHKE